MSPVNPSLGSFVQPSWDNIHKTGSVWVWPLAFYVRSCFEVMGASFLPEAKSILDQFEDEIQSYGIGSVSEYFEANPPYIQKGAISQATSVGALLEIVYLIDYWEKAAPAGKKTSAIAVPAKKTTTARKTTATKSTAAKKSTATKAATTTAAKPKRAPRAAKPKAE